MGRWIVPGRKATPEEHVQIYRSELRVTHSFCAICRMNRRAPDQEYPVSLSVAAHYGYVEGLPTRCALHRLPRMTMVSIKKCDEVGCDKFRAHGGVETKCKMHLGGWRCVVCTQFAVRSAQGVCYACRTGLERFRRDEEMVYGYLDAHASLRHYSYQDTPLPCAPTHRRPDRVYVLQDKMVVLEVDEDAHRFYARDCEVVRILEIHEQGGGLPMTMIRFKPTRELLPRLVETLEACIAKVPLGPIDVVFLGYLEKETYDIGRELSRMVQVLGV